MINSKSFFFKTNLTNVISWKETCKSVVCVFLVLLLFGGFFVGLCFWPSSFLFQFLRDLDYTFFSVEREIPIRSKFFTLTLS